MSEISTAKRLIAARSQAAAHVLGAGVFRACSQARFNQAAQAALADPEAAFTPDERDLIASLIRDEETSNTRGWLLRVLFTLEERDRLKELAASAGMSMSDYVRAALDKMAGE